MTLSAHQTAVEDSVVDFGTYALQAIHKLSARVRELEAELEERDKEVALLEAALERERGRHG